MASPTSHSITTADQGVLWAVLDERVPLATASFPFSSAPRLLPEPGAAPHGSSTAFVQWSEDGTLLAVATHDSVNIFDVHPNQQLSLRQRLGEVDVSFVRLSANGRWICTWRKPLLDGSDANVAVFCCISGRCVLRRRRPKLGVRDNGEPVQFGAAENSAWIQLGSEVQGFDLDALAKAAQQTESSDAAALAKFSWRLHVPGMARFWLSTSKTKARMLVLVPSLKGAPARINLHELPALDTALQSKSFFNSDDVRVEWNSTGTAVLVQASAAHDSTGASYYGSSALYLLLADPTTPPMTVCAPGTDGAVHDAAWNPSPNKKEFAVVCGRRAFICSAKTGEAVLDFGTLGWNRVCWSPDGRFLMLGGFGNLPGHMWFFARKEQLLLGTASDHGASPLGWSPDGRSLVTARCFPRRRVDNGFRVYSYAGELVADHKLDKVLHVGFVRSAGVALDRRGRAPSPAALARAKPLSAAASMENKPKAYRPPNARSNRTKEEASGVSAMLKQMRDDSDRRPRAVQQVAAESNQVAAESKQVAAEDAEAAAKRNAKTRARRERKAWKASEARAAKEQALKQEEMARVDAEQGWEVKRTKKTGDNAGNAKKPCKKASSSEEDKRVKQITKKLRQIVALRQKQSEGAVLDADQLEKVAKDGELRQELFAMGIVFQE